RHRAAGDHEDPGRGHPAPVDRLGRLQQRDVAVEGNPEAQRRRLPSHPQHGPVPAGQPARLRAGGAPAAAGRHGGAGPLDRAPGLGDPGAGGRRVRPLRLRRGGAAADELLQRGPGFAVPRHHQGPPLHDARKFARVPQRAVGDVPRGRGLRALDRAGPGLHRRRDVGLPAGRARGERALRHLVRRPGAAARGRAARAARLRGPAAPARTGGAGAGADARQRRDRRRARGRDHPGLRRGRPEPPGGPARRAALLLHQRRRGARRRRRRRRHRRERAAHVQAQVRALLAAPRRRGLGRGPPARLRALRLQRRGPGGGPPVVLSPKPNALAWLLVSLLVLVLDQLTKQWVLASLPEYTAIPVVEGFWNWYRTYHTGAAFSFLANAGGWQTWFFTVLAFAISALLTVWLARTPRGDWHTALPFALVIGGALGNVIDRLVHGHVIDFIQWHWRDHYWP